MDDAGPPAASWQAWRDLQRLYHSVLTMCYVLYARLLVGIHPSSVCVSLAVTAPLCRLDFTPTPLLQSLTDNGLTLRTASALHKDDACGWLSGVLTEAGSRSVAVRAIVAPRQSRVACSARQHASQDLQTN